MGQKQDKQDSIPSHTSSSKNDGILLVTSEFNAGEISKLLKDIKQQHPLIKVEILGKTSIDSLPHETLRATKYLLGYNNFPSPEQAPNLQFVQLFSAGSNHLQTHPLWNWKLDEVKWCSASGVHGPIIAEYVVMAILTHLHLYLSAIDSFQGAGE